MSIFWHFYIVDRQIRGIFLYLHRQIRGIFIYLHRQIRGIFMYNLFYFSNLCLNGKSTENY